MDDDLRLQRFANERRQSLLNALAYMKDITLLTDVTLICNGKPQPAHRVILAASSCYFRDIFQSKKKVSRINVHDVDEETFNAVVKFLYTGNLSIKDVEGLKLAKVLSAFRGLDVHCLDNITSSALSRVMTTNNFYAMWDLVKELQLKEAEAIVVKYVVSNLKECCHTQFFPLLTLQQMISLMSSKHLTSGNSSSNVILEAVAMWGSYDQERRAKYLTSLLSIIGLTVDPKLRQELLNYEESAESPNVVSQQPMAKQCRGLMSSMTYRQRSTESTCKLIDDGELDSDCGQNRSLSNETESIELGDIDRAKTRTKPFVLTDANETNKDFRNQFYTDYSSSVVSNSHTKPNAPARKRTVTFSQSKSDTDNSSNNSHNMFSTPTASPVRKLESVERSISSKNSTDTVKTDSNVKLSAKFDVENMHFSSEYILVMATTRYGVPVQQSYSTNIKQWLPMKKSSTLPLDAGSSLYFNRCLFVVGGETVQGNKLNTVYLLSLENQSIKKLSPLIVARSESGMAQLSGFVYVIGGRGEDNKPLTQVEFYYSFENRWQSTSNMRKPRIQPNAATADGLIYVVGGCSGDEFRINTTCEYFDSSSNQWTEMCPISRLHADSLLLVTNHQERIYAVQCQKPDKLFFYLPRQNKWVHMETNPRVTRVVNFFSLSKALWIVEKSGKILRYEDANNVWLLETKIPSDLVWPVNVHVVDFD